MTLTIDYALLAGVSYRSNRDVKNRFPVPSEWTEIAGTYRNLPSSGFEAISFTKGNEIVISYAGTDFSSLSTDFFYGNIPLALGNPSDQLRQAADYYLQIKQLNPGIAITFTGHSLGAGLASLMAVFLGMIAGRFYNNTMYPLSIAFLVLGLLMWASIVWADRGRKVEKSAA